MAMNAVMKKERTDLKDEIVSKVVNLGCACPTELAAQIGNGVEAEDLLAPLESLVQMGVLRPKVDSSDPRKYDSKYQIVYELAR
jgi:hypothetical protein